jgi:KaiC/GvpD/RAD55 family RecA-like ATPase
MAFPGQNMEPPRTSTGIPDLDAVLEGGFPANRVVVVSGGVGTGKTTFGLQFLLDGVRNGEPGTFVTVDEKPRHLIADATRFSAAFGPALEHGALTVLDASPFFTAVRMGRGSHKGIDVREVAADLVQEVSRAGARRLVIDTLTSLVPSGLTDGEVDMYVRALIQSVEDNAKCTTIVTCRGRRREQQSPACDSARALAAGILELRLVRKAGGIGRTMRVRKMRGTLIDPVDYQFTIEPGAGIVLSETVPGRVTSMLATASNL